MTTLTVAEIKKHVEHPNHYRHEPSGTECMYLKWTLPAFLSDALKYTWRMGKKEGEEEEMALRKAIFYLRAELRMRAESAFPNAATELSRAFSAAFSPLWAWGQLPENAGEAQRWPAYAMLGHLIEYRGPSRTFKPINQDMGECAETPFYRDPTSCFLRITKTSIHNALLYLEARLMQHILAEQEKAKTHVPPQEP